MFSASLISVLFHTARPLPAIEEPVRFPNLRSVADVLTAGPRYFDDTDIPVVASSNQPERLRAGLGPSFESAGHEKRDEGDSNVVWGRYRIGQLIEYFKQNYETPAEAEYLDSGTPVYPDATAPGKATAACTQLLAAAPLHSVAVSIGLVDEGIRAPGLWADTFGGRLHQVNGRDLAMSAHATSVLWALLERLKQGGVLHKTELYCSLVEPPKSHIGPSCFTHANSPEMLTALRGLKYAMGNPGRPILINLSMGTHVGPHNGDSPLETFVKTVPSTTAHRYLFVSAGNDGVSGISASRMLKSGRPDFLSARVNSYGAPEILIEFWWRHADGGNLSVSVEARDERGASLINAGSLMIDSNGSIGAQLTHRSRSGNTNFSSLFCANSHNGMSCIAFAMTNTAGLPALTEMDFTLRSQSDVTVHGWITVCADRKASFIAGGDDGTLRVPSTLDQVVCVTGVDSNGSSWPRSSRGPSVGYGSATGASVPHIAHLVEFEGEEGTSFASPRACADAAVLLASSNQQPLTSEFLARAILSNRGVTPSPWDARVGFGSIVT